MDGLRHCFTHFLGDFRSTEKLTYDDRFVKVLGEEVEGAWESRRGERKEWPGLGI